VYLIRNGIEWQRFASVQEQRASIREALRLPADAFVATTVCRLYRPRDFSTLLRAFQQVQVALPQAHLLVVGDGPLRGEVEREVAALTLTQAVHLLGMRRDVPQILGASDAFALASRGWEGLPLTVLEAMAASVPVVASDVGGTREAVTDGETGYLFQPGDVAALALRLRALADDPGLARQMGQRGQARVRELFTAERMVRETAALYEQLVS
jgi:glycosyltransferase involved in cell wall biosynthesis